jgi:arylsulfatase A-like enzyme
MDVVNKLGLERNTLVIFTNDNGGEWLSRNAPFSHRKGTVWEGGIRVPTIMKWPGKIPAEKISPQVGITMDLTRTILAVTDTPVPGNAALEGIDLIPILQSRSPVIERTLFFRVASTERQQRAVRQGDWKLMIDGGTASGSPVGPPMLLFNVRQDPSERDDLTMQQSDIIKRLHPLLKAWEADVDAEAKMLVTAKGGGH